MKISNKDFNHNLKPDFAKISDKINYSNFTKETKKVDTSKVLRKIAVGFSCCACLCLIMLPVLNFMNVNKSVKNKKAFYSLNEIKELQTDSFKPLNKVNYPQLSDEKQDYEVDKEYVNAIRQFTSLMNQQIDLSSQNIVYSPLSLYATLDLASLMSNDVKTLEEFDKVLGLSSQERNKNYDNMYKNNYFLTNTGTTQMYNGLFVTNDQELNQSILEAFTNRYVEAFQLDFQKDKDVDKVLEWIDEKVDSSKFLSKQDLDISDETMMTLVSTLYYKNKWSKNYLKSDSYTSSFYGKDSTSQVTYMYHSISTLAYDYGDYITFRDRYENNCSIKYIVPKDVSTLVYDVIKDKDIFNDDEEKKIYPENLDFGDKVIVKLSLPKFNTTYFTDFTTPLKSLGLNKAFERGQSSFNYAFSDLSDDKSVYLQYIKQKNKIEFDENGTIAKTVTFGQFAGAASSYELDALEVKLNQPFIYIIEDSNGLPLYVGSVNNL